MSFEAQRAPKMLFPDYFVIILLLKTFFDFYKNNCQQSTDFQSYCTLKTYPSYFEINAPSQKWTVSAAWLSPWNCSESRIETTTKWVWAKMQKLFQLVLLFTTLWTYPVRNGVLNPRQQIDKTDRKQNIFLLDKQSKYFITKAYGEPKIPISRSTGYL